jgi:hypothetical protein
MMNWKWAMCRGGIRKKRLVHPVMVDLPRKAEISVTSALPKIKGQ